MCAARVFAGQDHYVGGLKVALLFPAGWALSAVLSVGRAALQPEERARLVALREDEAHAALAARFEPAQAWPRPPFSMLTCVYDQHCNLKATLV